MPVTVYGKHYPLLFHQCNLQSNEKVCDIQSQYFIAEDIESLRYPKPIFIAEDIN